MPETEFKFKICLALNSKTDCLLLEILPYPFYKKLFSCIQYDTFCTFTVYMHAYTIFMQISVLLLLFIVFVYMKVVIAAGHLQDVMMSVISNDEKMQEASVS